MGNHLNRRASDSARHDVEECGTPFDFAYQQNAIEFFVPPTCGHTEAGRRWALIERECHLCGAAFGKAVSTDPVRVHNETPSHSLRSRLVGLPWG